MNESPVRDIFKMDDPEDNLTSWTGLLYPVSVLFFELIASTAYFCHIF